MRGGGGLSADGGGDVGRALTDFPRQGAGMFPTAPTAHTEKAQANGLGIGHNNRSQGLKARDNHPRGIHQIKPVLKSSNHSNVPFPRGSPWLLWFAPSVQGRGSGKLLGYPDPDY